MRRQTATQRIASAFSRIRGKSHVLMACFILMVCSSIQVWGQLGSGISISIQYTQNQFGCAAELYITNSRTDVFSIRITPPNPAMTTLVTSVASGYSALPIGSSIEFYRAPISAYPLLSNFKLAAISPRNGPILPVYIVRFLNAQGNQIDSAQIRPDCRPATIDSCTTNRLNISTGYNVNVGALYPAVSTSLSAIVQDQFWNIVASPNSAFNGHPWAIKFGYDGTGAHAVRPTQNYISSMPGGAYDYRRCQICVKKEDSITFDLDIIADNNATVNLLNSSTNAVVATIAPNMAPINFYRYRHFTQTLYLPPGEYCLQALVGNIDNSPTSLQIVGSVSSNNLSLTSPSCPCNATSQIGLCKYWDKNCDGLIDDGDEPMSGWTMNIKGLSDTSFNQTVTTARRGCTTVEVPAPGRYWITETQQSGWTASTPDSGYVVSVEPNTAYSYSFLNCKKPTCEQLFSSPEQEGECCATTLNISNADGASLQSLSYTVTGGVVNAVSSVACGILSSTPANINGTTSGTLNFNTACTMLNPMSLNIQTTATNATGNVCITWVGTFKQGSQTFTCSTQSCIQCRRMPKDCGNPLTVTPYQFAGTQTDWRTFTISNVKLPVSEISFVDIKFVNEPALHHNGGQLFAPTSRSWTVANSGGALDPYTQIRLGCNGAQATHGAASGSYVKFNLGVDNTLNYTGTVRIKIGYCDGDTCELEYLWRPSRTIRYNDTSITSSVRDHLELMNPRIFELNIDPPDSAVSMSVVMDDEEAKILAVSAPGPGGDSTKDSSGHSTDTLPGWLKVESKGNVVSYLPAESGNLGLGVKPRDWPRSLPACTLRVVYSPDPKKIKPGSDMPDSPSVSVRFYDADGRLMGFVEKDVVTGIKIDLPADAPAGALQPIGGGMSLDIKPNPTSTNAVMNLGLARSEIVSITLTDMQGKEIRPLINGLPVEAGNHTLALPTDELANGSYILTVRTVDGRTVAAILKLVK